MAEGMIEEFHRYLEDMKKAAGEDKTEAYENKRMEDYHFSCGAEEVTETILEAFETLFSL